MTGEEKLDSIEQAAADVGIGNNAARPANEIDLDAARKARREKRGPAPYVVFLGDRFELPRALPATVIDLVGDVSAGDFTKVTEAMRVLLGGSAYDAIVKKGEEDGDPLELDDVVLLLERALEIYEVTLPESKGSVRLS